MSIWGRVRSWFVRDGEHLTKVRIVDAASVAATPNDSYVRIWLTDLFLANEQEWFRDNYPAAHGSVRLQYGGREGVTFTQAVRPPEGQLGPGDRGDYALTPLVPFKGGTVELEAALTVLQGPSAVSAALDVLQDFSKLVGPPLGEALGIASRVSDGLERLLSAGDADVSLGYHRQFAAGGGGGDNVLRGGYHGLVRASQGTFGDDDFTIVDSKLHVKRGDGSEVLTGYDYMVFRIEIRRDRDDWRLVDLEKLIDQAKTAWGNGNEAGWKAFGNAAIAKARSHPDLTEPDSRRVARAIEQELLEARSGGLGAAPPLERSLEEIVAMRAMSIEQADLTAIELEDLLLDG